ncbi:MBL fold metallo-hydrolase [Nafulsella turpanensis]|uniref:MBL fold metallo-hydrolase n=1 Tax=Nafulsella turpanensis TaxID=1265690 RepID=UPI00034A3A02|nr:MBL fold metallo-hydrolase [Nafulsella turpanensis]
MGKFIYNSSLPFVKNNYNGNRIEKDRFTNFPFPDPDPSFKKVLKWKLSSNPQAAQKKSDPFKLDVEFMPSLPEEKGNYLIWLGHASFFIQYNGIRIITDPVFGNLPLIQRKAPLPLPIEELKGLDYILISHSHRDHFDKSSIQQLLKQNTKAVVLGPLRMENLLRKTDGDIHFQQAGWYQKFDTKKNISIAFLPAIHWHRRGLFDYNAVLWGSFLISGGTEKIYFGGDSAFGRHYQEIYDTVGAQDISLMPVGAYKPSFLMKGSHMSPDEAVKAADILRTKTLIPMHYGTFDVSDEPLGEPVERLLQLDEMEKINAKLEIIKPGAIFKFS